MRKKDWIVLAVIAKYGYTTQREITAKVPFSVGAVNASIKALVSDGYLDSRDRLTDKALEHIERNRPRRAVIPAAGPGLRMGRETGKPKGLLEVNGEVIIERLIRQLHEVDITEIYVVTGYGGEEFRYLEEKYGVSIIENDSYASRDSLHSVALAADKLENCYIVNSGLWFERNPFSRTEYFSWYAVSERTEETSFARVNRNLELVITEDGWGNEMCGLGYLSGETAGRTAERLRIMDKKLRYAKAIWEAALVDDDKLITFARILKGSKPFTINTREQLGEIEEKASAVGGS